MATAPSRAIFTKLSTPLHLLHSRFSSSSSNASPSYGGGSSVYKHKLQFQRPPTAQWKDWLGNSVSFIGRVVFPPTIVNSTKGFGVYTKLEVKSSRDTFGILLTMWDDMAKISHQHLKKDDFIYVSGSLGSYKKVDDNGRPNIYFKVVVDELNYVTCGGSSPDNQKFENRELKGGAVSTSGASSIERTSSSIERTRDRLHLWQVFFASPHEWWDNRLTKKNPRAPDFKHKDTGECLWLDPKDPPWVHKQLLLQDSRKTELGYHNRQNYRPRVSMWKFDG